MSRFRIAPGLHGSSPDHWRTWLENRLPEAQRDQRAGWATPNLEHWARQMGRALVSGADFFNLGPAVHINVATEHYPWPCALKRWPTSHWSVLPSLHQLRYPACAAKIIFYSAQ